ncbi:hypothetical protein IQ287_11075 [Burkholderia sp. R-69927]|uniref:hypothetical protein n=1 Tax=Paraburkholderia domus TaxID=2793075 RepID=UPI001914AA4C|nr:hypothetical protein [Paraburkholderia domus]MBK5061484.1 hypothetical protein [Burkholderia sp. R-70199]MBK5086526.1 hypothetical protein [Burkholderia sp. R-69927]
MRLLRTYPPAPGYRSFCPVKQFTNHYLQLSASRHRSPALLESPTTPRRISTGRNPVDGLRPFIAGSANSVGREWLYLFDRFEWLTQFS